MKKQLTTQVLLFLGLLFCSSTAFAQFTAKGKVMDKSGDPLIGVSILVKGSASGTTTDFDGNFSFKGLKKSSYNIITSYVSYEDKKVEYSAKIGNNLNIKLDNTL